MSRLYPASSQRTFITRNVEHSTWANQIVYHLGYQIVYNQGSQEIVYHQGGQEIIYYLGKEIVYHMGQKVVHHMGHQIVYYQGHEIVIGGRF